MSIFLLEENNEYFDDVNYPWIEVPVNNPEYDKKYQYFKKKAGTSTWYKRVDRK